MRAMMIIVGICCELVAMFMVRQGNGIVGSITAVVVAVSTGRMIDRLGTVAYGFFGSGNYTAVLYDAIGVFEDNGSA